MFGELERLALAVTTVSWADAKRVVEVANQQLNKLLGAQMVQLYWDKEAQEGALLEPVAFVNNTGHEDPRPFEITSEPNGPLSWVYHTGRPLWLENIEPDMTTAQNAIDDTEVPGDYLSLRRECSSMLVIPLKPRVAVRGVYSVELRESGRITQPLVDVMTTLGRSLVRVLASADMHEYDTRQAGRAISKFLDDAQGIAIDPVFLTTEVRNCFVARQFDHPGFEAVQTRVETVLGGQEIRASAYEPESGKRVIDEIAEQIRRSHFCVADITGQDPNVMFEVGMMAMSGKDVILIRDVSDTSEIPYDIADRAVYSYVVEDDVLMTSTAAGGDPVAFDDVVSRFVGGLSYDTGFASAQPYRPQ